jgi:hypothetical protein
MLKLEANTLGAWGELPVPQSILDDIEVAEGHTSKGAWDLIEVGDFPSLDKWMKQQGLRQAYVWRTYKPDVKERKK